ncbi:MAG TPA: hypothetical protein VEU47_02145 [Candidatus Cybelea sp.]|nr:hypothetical protein [Candidatus Cybelea sp.]
MSAATYDAETKPAGSSPWRPLLWLVPLTGFWLALTYAFPALQASGAPTVATRLAIHMVLALGLWLGLERTTLSLRQRVNTFLALSIPYVVWLSIVWGVAINGAFLPGHFPPRLPIAIFLPVVFFLPFVLASKRIGQLLDAMPASWLVGLQVYRVLGGAFLVALARGAIPGIFGLPTGIGDMLTGLLALPVAYGLAAGNGDSRRAALAWNIFGLVDFTIAVGIGLAISPGPFQLIVPSIPNTASGTYPAVLIPAFVVPSSILLHALSLRQLRRRGRVVAVP